MEGEAGRRRRGEHLPGAPGRWDGAGRRAAPRLPAVVVTVLAGLWLLGRALGWPQAVAAVAEWNDGIVGTLLLAAAVVGRVGSPAAGEYVARVVAVAGCWLVLAPALLRYDTGPRSLVSTWNDAVVGVVVLFAAALWSRRGPVVKGERR